MTDGLYELLITKVVLEKLEGLDKVKFYTILDIFHL